MGLGILKPFLPGTAPGVPFRGSSKRSLGRIGIFKGSEGFKGSSVCSRARAPVGGDCIRCLVTGQYVKRLLGI